MSKTTPADIVPFSPVKREATYGTGYQGVLAISYADLVGIFGEPNLGPSLDGKVKAEWAFESDRGVLFTIYDYKSDLDPELNPHWHIGGKNLWSVIEVISIVGTSGRLVGFSHSIPYREFNSVAGFSVPASAI